MPKNASKTDIAIERFGKAIGNRTRVQILQSLAGGPKSVKTLVETVGAISQPAVSQHLRTLRTAELVSAKRGGQEVPYSFNPKQYHGMLRVLASSIGAQRQ